MLHTRRAGPGTCFVRNTRNEDVDDSGSLARNFPDNGGLVSAVVAYTNIVLAGARSGRLLNHLRYGRMLNEMRRVGYCNWLEGSVYLSLSTIFEPQRVCDISNQDTSGRATQDFRPVAFLTV